MRYPALLLLLLLLTTSGCSTGVWTGGAPQSPLLGVDNQGIWRFPTPQPPPSADIVPAPSATSSSSAEPGTAAKPRTRSRTPKPFAKRSTAMPTLALVAGTSPATN